jgi:hypothetical protein
MILTSIKAGGFPMIVGSDFDGAGPVARAGSILGLIRVAVGRAFVAAAGRAFVAAVSEALTALVGAILAAGSRKTTACEVVTGPSDDCGTACCGCVDGMGVVDRPRSGGLPSDQKHSDAGTHIPYPPPVYRMKVPVLPVIVCPTARLQRVAGLPPPTFPVPSRRVGGTMSTISGWPASRNTDKAFTLGNPGLGPPLKRLLCELISEEIALRRRS